MSQLQLNEVLYIAVVALSGAIVSMAVYIIRLHKKMTKEQKEWHEELKGIHEKTINEGALNRTAIENNTKVFDRVMDYITKATK